MFFTAYFGVASAVDRAVMDDARACTGWIRFVLKHSGQRKSAPIGNPCNAVCP
jgi:hypothetical protein